MQPFVTHPHIFWHNQRRDAIAAAAREDGVVLVPTGAIEQHGPHLPLSTDICDSTAISAIAAAQIADFPVLVAPPIWWGLSPYHMVYPGTITLRLETFVEVLTDVCDSIRHHGFRNIVVVNGHGGNAALLEATAIKLASRGAPIAAVTYWNLVPDAMRELFPEDGGSIGHAGSAETSLQLAVEPSLVAPGWREALPPTGNGQVPSRSHNDGVLMPGAYTPPDILGESIKGVFGNPAHASEERGRRLLDAAASALADFVRAYRRQTSERAAVRA